VEDQQLNLPLITADAGFVHKLTGSSIAVRTLADLAALN